MTQSALCFPPPMPDDVRSRIDRAMSDPEMSPCAKAVLIQLVGYPATGSGRAVSIEMLRSTFAVVGIRQYGPREIKAAVKELVEDRGVPVGSRRTKPYGYFVACDADDLNDAERPLIAEIRSLARRVRSINPKSELSRMICGQLEIQEPASTPACAAVGDYAAIGEQVAQDDSDDTGRPEGSILTYLERVSGVRKP